MKAFIFDLDGVLYRGSEPISDAVETLLALQARGVPTYFLTNNSGLTREQYSHRLQRMGIPASPEQFMTSAWATARFLQSWKPDACLFVVGEPGLREELHASGFRFTENPETEAADAVVVGIDKSFTYERLRLAQYTLLSGARLIATNADATYPAEGGRVLPGAGTMVAAIQTAGGAVPFVVGKPNVLILDLLLQEAGMSRSEAFLVGDRLDTDISLAKQAGVPCALALTGISTREEANALPAELKPDYIWDSLKSLLPLLDK